MLKKEYIGGFCLLVSSSCAFAAEFDANAYSSLEYSDNALLASTDLKSESSQIFGLSLEFEENRKNFQSDGSITIEEERKYSSPSDSTTSLSTGFGLISVGFVESFLDWTATFNRTELLDAPLANRIDDNREFRTVVTTGPALTYRFSRVALVNMNSNVIFVENSDPDVADSKRSSSDLTFTYAVNTITDVSIGADYESLIDGDGEEKFDTTTVNVGLVRRFYNGDLSLSVGQQRVEPEVSESTDSLFASFGLQRSDLVSHDFSFQYGRSLSDTGIGFEESERVDSSFELLEGASRIDIVVLENYDLSISRGLNTLSYSLGFFFQSEDYRDQDLDEKVRGFNISVNERLSSGLSLGLYYNYEARKLLEREDFGREQTRTYRSTLNYSFTPRLDFNGAVGFEIRRNNKNQDRDYEEITFSLGVNYDIW